MELVSDKEKRKYSGRKRKTMPMIVSFSIIFMLVGMALAKTTTTGVSEFWYQNDDTLVQRNTTLNVLIGANRSSTYKFEVNGTSFFNDTIDTLNHGDSSEWNTAYLWGDHSGLYALLNHWHNDTYFTKTELQQWMPTWNSTVGGFWKMNTTTVVLNETSDNVNIGQDAPTRFKLNVKGDTNIERDLNVSGDTTVKNILGDETLPFFIIGSGVTSMSLYTNQVTPTVLLYNTGEVAMPYQSACRVRMNNNQLIPRITWTKLLMPTEDYDQNDDYASLRFVAPKDGVYLITYSVSSGTVSSGVQLACMIYRNGAVAGGYETSYAIGSVSLSNSGSDCLTLRMGNYIELFVYHNSIGSIWFTPSTVTNYMTVCKIA